MNYRSKWLFPFSKSSFNVIGVLFLYLLSQAIIVVLLGPAKSELVALQMTLNANDAIAIIESWSPEIWNGIWGHFKWDFVHPFIYSYCLAVWIQASRRKHTDRISKLVPFAFIVGFLDIIENICHYAALSRFPETIEILLVLGGALAICKWTVAAILLVITLISVLIPSREKAAD